LQGHELAHELSLRHWSLWVRHLSGVLKLPLEVSLALLALALVGIPLDSELAKAVANRLAPMSADRAVNGVLKQLQ
jgi:hypothetical protein